MTISAERTQLWALVAIGHYTNLPMPDAVSIGSPLPRNSSRASGRWSALTGRDSLFGSAAEWLPVPELPLLNGGGGVVFLLPLFADDDGLELLLDHVLSASRNPIDPPAPKWAAAAAASSSSPPK
jgi:hypothetical protein